MTDSKTVHLNVNSYKMTDLHKSLKFQDTLNKYKIKLNYYNCSYTCGSKRKHIL